MFNVHIQKTAVVAHACHGHRYRPSPIPLSGTEKKGEGVMGGPSALAGTRDAYSGYLAISLNTHCTYLGTSLWLH